MRKLLYILFLLPLGVMAQIDMSKTKNELSEEIAQREFYKTLKEFASEYAEWHYNQVMTNDSLVAHVYEYMDKNSTLSDREVPEFKLTSELVKKYAFAINMKEIDEKEILENWYDSDLNFHEWYRSDDDKLYYNWLNPSF